MSRCRSELLRVGCTTFNQLQPRTFSSLSEAEEENGQSRIYLGIHWSFDKSEGIKQGQHVARYVFSHAFQRVPQSID